MKNIFSKFVIVAFLFSALTGTAFAEKFIGAKQSSKPRAELSKAAQCKRAQSTAELNVNNVRAMINGYGNMWYDGSVAQYHLPKNSNTCPLYCAALWIGGSDINDQLRIAALRFGQDGDDFWPGPLTIDGSASVDLAVCNEYDKHFVISKSDVQQLMSMFSYTEDGVEKNEATFDPSLVPQIVQEWPAHGNTSLGQTKYLAPFYDADGDGEYSWENGDYPYYDFDNELCPRTLKASLKPGENYSPTPTMEDQYYDDAVLKGGILSDQVLKGDQTIWWVFNDMGNVHTETDGQPIGLEIRAQAFAFSTNDEINNMTFYSYEIINRSTYELKDTYFSQWVDPDLGYAYDDFVGCDVKRGLGYCYNGDESDGPGSGSYSGIPPAVGIDFFQGPYMDADGKDNPKIDIEKMKLYYPEQLNNYLLADGSYDTISLTDDADLFYPDAWYFKPGDAVGNCAINGVNFGNNIVDDERFGMRRFVYYNNDMNSTNGEPSKASDYYNYLRGYWKTGQRMTHGGNGTVVDNAACDFMFPGDSDPLHWGTDGVVPSVNPNDWSEVTSGDQVSPGDRRFMQSAGPFTLKPGALNYITVGIPFAQATSGNAWSSVELLREIDDVCQALFENCFKVLDGPDAPTLVVQELANEVILYITYDNPESNNYGEKYSEIDPAIVRSYTDAQGNSVNYTDDQRSYKFEGYQIYQLKDANTSIADIGDPSKARLVAQCDIENYYDTLVLDDNNNWVENPSPSVPIGTLVNYETNSTTGLLTGQVMVQGENKGVKHVFRVTIDQFARGTSTALVNNQEYYYICVAYAHNRYKEYSQTSAAFLDGQKEPYLAGRKDEWGRTITSVTAIPHDPSSENGGTIIQSEFGMSPNITRIEGYGNGGNNLILTKESVEELMGAPGVPGMAPGQLSSNPTRTMEDPCVIANPTYEQNYGPINVRVIDPLNIKAGKFTLNFVGASTNSKWYITNADTNLPLYVGADGNPVYVDSSDYSIGRYNEQLFLDLGISVAISNPAAVASPIYIDNNSGVLVCGVVNDGAVLSSSMTFADNSMAWLSGIPDNDSYAMYNWIRSGSQYAASDVVSFSNTDDPISGAEPYLDADYYNYQPSRGSTPATSAPLDKYQVFEGVVNGMWSPYALVSTREYHPGFSFRYFVADQATFDTLAESPYVNISATLKAHLAKTTYNRTLRQLMNNSNNKSLIFNDMSKLPSVQIVLTSDTSKWTRCPVIEMCEDHTQAEGQAHRFQMRKHLSVDKNGMTVEDLGIEADANDPSNPAYIAEEGMGWFPGYAISLATGERLNVIFGEDSRYVQYNGRDMMWNPVSALMDGTQNYVLGGRHFIYVMNSTTQPYYKKAGSSVEVSTFKTPSYDAGRWAVKMLNSSNNLLKVRDGKKFLWNGILASESSNKLIAERDSISMFYASAAWVNIPLVNDRYAFTNPQDIPCDVTININVNMPYGARSAMNNMSVIETGNPITNNNNPKFMFEFTEDVATLTQQATAANAQQSYKDSLLSLITVVPNPYYSYSTYETLSQLETKVRFVNLPTVKGGCTISIFTVDGTLVRRLVSAENATTLDWDLLNHVGLPIASGMYLIHINVPGIGECVVKWFGTMRPPDLNSFQF